MNMKFLGYNALSGIKTRMLCVRKKIVSDPVPFIFEAIAFNFILKSV